MERFLDDLGCGGCSGCIGCGWFGCLGCSPLIFIIFFFLHSCFVESDYEKGLKYYESEKYTEAVKYFEKSLSNKSSIHDELYSSYFLGECYRKGLGVKEDPAKAIEYLKKVADKESDEFKEIKGESCRIIGILFFEGKNGVEKNHREAFKWFEKAYNYGCDDALLNLGYSYFEGKGVNQDSAKAFKFFKKAAANSNCSISAQAYSALGECYEKGLGIEKDRSEALECFRRAAEGGDTTAQCWLGHQCRMNRNYAKSVEWYRKAAAQNNPEGLKGLAWHYRYGCGVDKDTVKAKMLEEKAKVLQEKNGEE